MAGEAPGGLTRAQLIDRGVTVALGALAALICAALVLIVGGILLGGASHISLGFLSGDPSALAAGGGIGPEIFNSFYLLVITLAISGPLSMGAAIHLSLYAGDHLATSMIRTLIEMLSSVPSIVVGLFGMLIAQLIGWRFSIISGALALTVFNVPILVRVIEQALEAVPVCERDAGLALGLTRWETALHVLIPAAIPGIVTGVIISAGRIFGEAAALIYTAGQTTAHLDFSCFDLASPTCPWNIFRPAETLAVHIWKLGSEGVVPDRAAVAAGAAAVLMVCVLAFNIAARVAGHLLAKRVSGT